MHLLLTPHSLNVAFCTERDGVLAVVHGTGQPATVVVHSGKHPKNHTKKPWKISMFLVAESWVKPSWYLWFLHTSAMFLSHGREPWLVHSNLWEFLFGKDGREPLRLPLRKTSPRTMDRPHPVGGSSAGLDKKMLGDLRTGCSGHSKLSHENCSVSCWILFL